MWIAIVLSASLALPVSAGMAADRAEGVSSDAVSDRVAKEDAQALTQVFIHNAENFGENAIQVSGLKITGCESPSDGSESPQTDFGTEPETTTDVNRKAADSPLEGPVSDMETTGDTTASAAADAEQKASDESSKGLELDDEATVISEEGVSWEIPVFWVRDNKELVRTGQPGKDCMPVLAFYVPEEYAVKNEEEKAGFEVTLDEYLTGLFETAGGAVCFYEPKTKITYILAAGTEFDVLNTEEGKLPAEPIPGLPEELRKPTDGSYDNPSSKKGSGLSEEQDEGEESGRPDSSGGDTPGLSEEPSKAEPSGDEEDSGKTDSPAGTKDPGQTDSSEDSAASDGKQEENSEGSAETGEEQSSGGSAETGETETSDGTGNTEEDQTSVGSGETADSSEEKEALTREQLLAHCSNSAIRKIDEDELAELVDLVINSIVPQAVSLLKTKFPAFSEAAEEGGLGEEIGLYVYRLYGEYDGVKAHSQASASSLAYVEYDISRNEEGEAELSYILGLNTYYFLSRGEDGKEHIDTSGQASADLDNTILHELLHAFMMDYNRTGSIGTADPEDYFKSVKVLERAQEVYAFPTWFVEGMASSVENVYQYRYEYFQLLRYAGEGVIGDRYGQEDFLKTYLTNTFIMTDGSEYEDSYDLENSEDSASSAYVTGYLADLYLGQMAAEYENAGSAIIVDENGNKKVSSETIRTGLNSILKRLHEGESLDEIIRSISGGRYQDTDDFEKKFIKGEGGAGDQDSLAFCVDFLNYMQDVAENNEKIPNGSILFDFDEDFTTPIDRSVRMDEDNYQIVDSSDYVASTVNPGTPYTDGGKSDASGTAGESSGKSLSTSQAAKESSEDTAAEPAQVDESAETDASAETDTEDTEAGTGDTETATGETETGTGDTETVTGETETDTEEAERTADTAEEGKDSSADEPSAEAQAADESEGAEDASETMGSGTDTMGSGTDTMDTEDETSEEPDASEECADCP